MYHWKGLKDREFEQLKNYADEVVTHEVKERRGTGIDKKHCLNRGKHLWFRKWKSRNVVVRYCAKRCGMHSIHFYSNGTLRMMAKQRKHFRYE